MSGRAAVPLTRKIIINFSQFYRSGSGTAARTHSRHERSRPLDIDPSPGARIRGGVLTPTPSRATSVSHTAAIVFLVQPDE